MKLTSGFFKMLFVILFALQISAGSTAQNIYNVGNAKTSIEPGNDLISLTLGGYAAPWDGRFTLQWKEIDKLPEFTAITGVNDALYIVNKGKLMKRKIDTYDNNSKIGWVEIAKVNDIKFMSGYENKILVINSKGDLSSFDIRGKKHKWNLINTINFPVKSFTFFEDLAYVSDDKGDFWICNISDKNPAWKKTEYKNLDNVIDLAANDKRLIALTDDGAMYYYGGEKRDHKWIKTAYKNNITIKENIRDIVMINNTIYGVDDVNVLYAGEHRSEGGLGAHAVSINDGENTVVIVGLDLVGIDYSFVEAVKKEINNSIGLPPSAVFINVSHTHFAPISQNWHTWQESNRYADSTYLYGTIKSAILDVVKESLENVKPANIYFGRGTTGIGYNRRNFTEIYDSDVDVIKLDFVDSKKENYIFMASCHPVHSVTGTLHYTISANYPGVARNLLEERTNTSNSLFLQGTAGDINPVDNGQYITGERLSNDVISVLGKPMNQLSGPISFFFDSIEIPINPKSREEILEIKKQNINETNVMIAERNNAWCDLMLEYYDNGTMPHALPVYIQTINIGDWKLVGFSRETTSEYSMGVKEMWPDKQVSVVGYTNDVASYLPTKLHIDAGVYEGKESFCWYGMPNIFPDNIKETLLSFVKKNNR